MKRTLFKIILVVCGLVVGFILCEIGARVWLWRQFSIWPEHLTDNIPTDPNRDIKQVETMRTDENPRIIFRLKPGLRGQLMNVPVELNHLGMRCDDLFEERTSDTLRIVSLGDSTMFGWRVHREESYMEVTRAELQRHFGDSRRVELLNMAVPGYMTVQEVELFLEEGLRYKPDIVVIQFDPNDFYVPYFVLRPRLFRLDKLYLREVRRLMRGEYAKPEAIAGDGDLSLIPEEYRSLQDWKAFHEAVETLAQSAKGVGARVYAVMLAEDVPMDGSNFESEPKRAARETFQNAGFKIIDTHPPVAEFMLAHGLDFMALCIDSNDKHPNPARHQIMADEIVRVLKSDLKEPR